MLALVWAPVRFAPAWALANHLVDLFAFSLFTFFTDGSTSPFFIYFTFLVICGTLRWDVRGAVWTAIVSFAVYAATALYASYVFYLRPFATNTFVVRSVYLVVTAALIAYLGAYHRRFQREIFLSSPDHKTKPRWRRQPQAEHSATTTSVSGLIFSWNT